MEASKFGFGPNTPPAFKFDPTDADLVACYLLPHALGLANPHAHAIIEDDPGSVPPWELLQKHGHGKLDHAFFFGPPKDATRNGGRKNRTIKGVGVWQGQKGSEGTVTLLHPGGGELDITFKRYNLTFCRTKRGASTGYIMHEYEIISPPLPGTVLTRVKINKKSKKGKELVETAAGEQPGTSYEYDALAMASNSNGFGDAQAGALYGGNGGDMADTGCYYTPLKCVFPEGEYKDYCFPVTDQPGANYSYNAAAAMKSDGQGFTGAQADAFSAGGMVETDGAYYDPSQFVPVASGAYNNDCGQYQEVAPWSYQLGQSRNHSQYMAGDAAVMGSLGEGFSVEQQAGALCGHAEDAAVMGSLGEGFSVEQQAGALCGHAEDAAVMRSHGQGFSVEQQAGALCGRAEDAAVMRSHGEGFSVEQQAGALYGHAEDAAVMRYGGEGFSVEQQAGALSGHAEDAAMMCFGGVQQAGALRGDSDNGSVMRIESADSTISLCDGGEENGDEIDDVLFGDHDGDFNFEQSDDDFNFELSDEEAYNILFGDNNVYSNREQSDAGGATANPQ